MNVCIIFTLRSGKCNYINRSTQAALLTVLHATKNIVEANKCAKKAQKMYK